jgi:NAD(P)-dependent dehydrogenase (short-subunit alcohol dehydrogenase family)
MELAGRVALITGGRRMGAAVARRLAAGGADIALVYRESRDAADAAADDVRALGQQAITLHADLADADACTRVVTATQAAFGRLDILVNMASIYPQVAFDALTVDHWDAQLNVDARAAFLCARAAVPHMRDIGGGRIINVTDWTAASRRPRYFGYLPYYVAKHAVIGLTEALSLELAADRILVNAVAPGPMLPPDDMSPDEQTAVTRVTPLGRWGGADEIAEAIGYLIASDFVTGETIRVDGGRHIQ